MILNPAFPPKTARFQKGGKLSAIGACCLLLAFLFLPLAGQAQEAAPLDLAPLKKWLAYQSKVKTFAAHFTQSRRVKNFKKPLQSPGKLWFSAPGRFRWEIGDPPKNIAFLDQKELVIYQPGARRVKRFALSDVADSQWADTFNLAKMSFPHSLEELQKYFSIVSLQSSEQHCVLALQLKSERRRKLVKMATIYFNPEKSGLLATEILFQNGSSIRNDFTETFSNIEIPEAAFKMDFPEGTRFVEPLKR